jgi:hypothetical protein
MALSPVRNAASALYEAAVIVSRTQRFTHGSGASSLRLPSALPNLFLQPLRPTLSGGSASAAPMSLRHFRMPPGGQTPAQLAKWPAPFQSEQNARSGELSTKGRLLPPITPQTLGAAVSREGIAGQWPADRAALPKAFLANLRGLEDLKGEPQAQLGNELNLHAVEHGASVGGSARHSGGMA